MRGLEDGNVISVAKHFPGHGSVSADSHKLKGVIDRSLHEMDSIDLYPFRKWVEQCLTGVMVGHLAVPSIDSEMRPPQCRIRLFPTCCATICSSRA